jgi:hypothetical protein
MILVRRKFCLFRESVIKIQKLIRRLIECAPDKSILSNLKNMKMTAAAIKIQKCYKNYRMKHPISNMGKKGRRKTIHHLKSRKSIAKQTFEKLPSIDVQGAAILEEQAMDDMSITDIPIKHDRDTKDIKGEAFKIFDYNTIMKPRQNVAAKKKVKVKRQAEQLEYQYEDREDEVPPPVFGQNVNQYIQSKEPEGFLTASLGKNRTDMMEQMKEEFDEIGEPISIPDGFLTAQRYISKKSSIMEEKMKIAFISSPVDNSLLIKNIQKRAQPIHPERPYNILIIECHKSRQLSWKGLFI